MFRLVLPSNTIEMQTKVVRHKNDGVDADFDGVDQKALLGWFVAFTFMVSGVN